MNTCNNVHPKWPIYQVFLTHLARFFFMCMYTNVLSWAKMAQLSGMFIYPVVHLSGVHCSNFVSMVLCSNFVSMVLYSNFVSMLYRVT